MILVLLGPMIECGSVACLRKALCQENITRYSTGTFPSRSKTGTRTIGLPVSMDPKEQSAMREPQSETGHRPPAIVSVTNLDGERPWWPDRDALVSGIKNRPSCKPKGSTMRDLSQLRDWECRSESEWEYTVYRLKASIIFATSTTLSCFMSWDVMLLIRNETLLHVFQDALSMIKNEFQAINCQH